MKSYNNKDLMKRKNMTEIKVLIEDEKVTVVNPTISVLDLLITVEVLERMLVHLSGESLSQIRADIDTFRYEAQKTSP